MPRWAYNFALGEPTHTPTSSPTATAAPTVTSTSTRTATATATPMPRVRATLRAGELIYSDTHGARLWQVLALAQPAEEAPASG